MTRFKIPLLLLPILLAFAFSANAYFLPNNINNDNDDDRLPITCSSSSSSNESIFNAIENNNIYAIATKNNNNNNHAEFKCIGSRFYSPLGFAIFTQKWNWIPNLIDSGYTFTEYSKTRTQNGDLHAFLKTLNNASTTPEQEELLFSSSKSWSLLGSVLRIPNYQNRELTWRVFGAVKRQDLRPIMLLFANSPLLNATWVFPYTINNNTNEQLYSFSVLGYAAKLNYWGLVRNLFAKNVGFRKDAMGDKLLVFDAIQRNDLPTLKLLKELGADLTSSVDVMNNNSPFGYAMKLRRYAMVEYLSSKSVKPVFTSDNNNSGDMQTIHEIFHEESTKHPKTSVWIPLILKLSQNWDMSSVFGSMETSLSDVWEFYQSIHAANHTHIETVIETNPGLLNTRWQFGSKILHRANELIHHSPLSVAISLGHIKLAHSLFRKGAQWGTDHIGGIDTFFWAIYNRDMNAVKSMLEMGASLTNACPVHYSMVEDNHNSIDLEYGREVMEYSPLGFAIRLGYDDIANLLITNARKRKISIQLSVSNNFGDKFLVLGAILSNDTTRATNAITIGGADIRSEWDLPKLSSNSNSKWMYSYLGLSIRFRNEEILRVLCEYGATFSSEKHIQSNADIYEFFQLFSLKSVSKTIGGGNDFENLVLERSNTWQLLRQNLGLAHRAPVFNAIQDLWKLLSTLFSHPNDAKSVINSIMSEWFVLRLKSVLEVWVLFSEIRANDFVRIRDEVEVNDVVLKTKWLGVKENDDGNAFVEYSPLSYAVELVGSGGRCAEILRSKGATL